MSTDFNETPGAPRYRKAGSDSKSVAELFKNPVVKMIAVVAVIGGVGMAALHFSNTHQTQEQSALPVVDTSQNQAPPDAEITPEYAQAIQDADAQRVAQARAEGDTAMPSIMDAPVMNPSVDPNATNQEDQDPLREFEALVKRNDEPEVPAPVAAPAGPQINPEAVMALSDAMRSQMETLMHNWDPVPMNVLTTEVRDADLQQNNSGLSNVSAQSDIQGKVIVPAGSVYYGQMLMEANSDVPGPIMAQILTGDRKSVV